MVRAVVKFVALQSWRDLKTFRSITGQNLFLFVLLVALQPESAQFFAVLLALVVAFPVAADPIKKIPLVRWQLWPLSRSQSALLTLFVKRGSASKSRASVWKLIPKPPGAAGFLMRLCWRELLSTLDPYVAALLCIITLLYESTGKPLDRAAPRIMALLVVLALSTSAQVLIAIDGTGETRYRLLPLRGWRILLAKNLAWLLLLAPLVLPLNAASGFGAGFSALAVGNYRCATRHIPQQRWRFTSGTLFPDGLIQTIFIFAAGNGIASLGATLFLVCLFAWALSVLVFGWLWDRARYAP